VVEGYKVANAGGSRPNRMGRMTENIPERQERLQSRVLGGSGMIFEANAFGVVIQNATVHRHGWLRLNVARLYVYQWFKHWLFFVCRAVCNVA